MRGIAILLFMFSFVCQAQRSKIDSLHQLLRQHPVPDTARVDLLVELGYRYFQSQPDSALYFANQGFELAQRLNYQRGRAWALNRMAIAQAAKGHLSLATQYYHRALTIFEQIGDERGQASTFNNIGYMLRLQKQYDESLKYTLAAYQISERNNTKPTLAVNLTNLGWIYLLKKDYPTALSYSQRAVGLADSLGDSYYAAISRHIVGQVWLKQGKYQLARQLFGDGLAIAEKGQLKQQTAFHLLGLGEVYVALGDYPNAQASLARALAVAQEVAAPEILLDVSDLLTKINREAGRHREAFEYDDIYHAAKDSVFSVEQNRQINRLKFEFDSERKQQELKTLAQEKDLQTELKQFYLYLVLGAGATALFIALYATQLYFGQKKLRWAYDRLTQQQKVLAANNLEIAQQTQALLKQAEQLKELHRVKDQTLSIIAHDLRGPLTALQGVIEILDPDIVDPSEFAFIKANLTSQYTNVNTVLENLLNWARRQFEGAGSVKENISVYDLAQEVGQLYEPIAAAKFIALTHLMPPDLSVQADPSHLRLILRNLVNNAIKFTPEHGRIEVLATLHSPLMVAVEVRDNGVGMSPEQVDKLFDQRRSFSTLGTQNELGTGLGLLLCKEFVEKNHGTIWVESQMGKGTSFHFTLPQAVLSP